MSEVEKMTIYNSMKKSPIASGFLEIIPTAGYAYSGNWKRGIIIRFGISAATSIIAGLHVENDIESETSKDAFIGTFILWTGLYGVYDTMNLVSEYNKRLQTQIFGKEISNLGFNLYPFQDGAGISLTYSFN